MKCLCACNTTWNQKVPSAYLFKKTANLITLITSTSATHTRFPRLDQNSDVVSLTLTSILFCEEANGKKPNLASSAGGGQQLGSRHSAM